MLAHQRLRALIVAALQAAPAVSTTVLRSTSQPLPMDKNDGIAVRVLGGKTTSILLGEGAPIDWRASVSILCVARAANSQPADEAVAPLLSAVHARLMNDTNLSQAGFQLHPELQIVLDEDEEFDDRIGSAEMRLTYQWRSSQTTLEDDSIWK